MSFWFMKGYKLKKFITLNFNLFSILRFDWLQQLATVETRNG